MELSGDDKKFFETMNDLSVDHLTSLKKSWEEEKKKIIESGSEKVVENGKTFYPVFSDKEKAESFGEVKRVLMGNFNMTTKKWTKYYTPLSKCGISYTTSSEEFQKRIDEFKIPLYSNKLYVKLHVKEVHDDFKEVATRCFTNNAGKKIYSYPYPKEPRQVSLRNVLRELQKEEKTFKADVYVRFGSMYYFNNKYCGVSFKTRAIELHEYVSNEVN